MPIADFTLSPQITDVSHTDIEFTNESSNADEYVWDFGDETELSNDTDPTHNYADIPNEYPITLWALNNDGLCRDSIQKYVTILPLEDASFYQKIVFKSTKCKETK